MTPEKQVESNFEMTKALNYRYCRRVVLTCSRVGLVLITAVTSSTGLAGAQMSWSEPPLWSKQVTTGATNTVSAATHDQAGGFYFGGTTEESLGGPHMGKRDAWFARYDDLRNQIWIRQIGSVDHDDLHGAAPDGSGGVYVGGAIVGASSDAWLARYSSGGSQVWTLQFGTVASDGVFEVAPDGSGGVYVGGGTSGNLGGPHLGTGDAFVARFDSAGNQLWVRQLGTPQAEQGDFVGVAPDGSGGVYISGLTYGNLGGPNNGLSDIWLARFDSAGNHLWTRQFGSNNYDYLYAAAPDSSGGVFIAGNTWGNLAGSHGSIDAWVARYNSAGNQLWLRQVGTSYLDTFSAAAPSGSGGVYLAGTTYGSLGWTNPNPGTTGDALLMRYDSNGNQLTLWTCQGGTTGNDALGAVAPDGSGGVFGAARTDTGGVEGWSVRFLPATWVDFAYGGPEGGSFNQPFNTLSEANAAVASGGMIRIKTGTSSETGAFKKACSIESYNGPATIGK